MNIYSDCFVKNIYNFNYYDEQKKCYENALYFKDPKYSAYLTLGNAPKVEKDIKKRKQLSFGEIGNKLSSYEIKIKIVDRKKIKNKDVYGMTFINNIREFVKSLKNECYKSDVWKNLF